MEKDKFKRAIEINKRLVELNDVLKAISTNKVCSLNYVNKTNKCVLGWKREYISDLFDKHDKIIRAEIQQ